MIIDKNYEHAFNLTLATWDSVLRSAEKFHEPVSDIIFRRYCISYTQAMDIAQSVAKIKGCA